MSHARDTLSWLARLAAWTAMHSFTDLPLRTQKGKWGGSLDNFNVDREGAGHGSNHRKRQSGSSHARAPHQLNKQRAAVNHWQAGSMQHADPLLRGCGGRHAQATVPGDASRIADGQNQLQALLDKELDVYGQATG